MSRYINPQRFVTFVRDHVIVRAAKEFVKAVNGDVRPVVVVQGKL